MRWTVEVLNATVRAELEAQPKDIRARYLRIVGLIESHGLERVREPYVKHLEGPLWEMRMKGRDRIARRLRNRHGPARRRGPGVRQEDCEDAPT